MAGFNTDGVTEFLQEISPDAPCGANLEYDPAFLELEQAVKGKAEAQFGKTISAEVPPDWKQVRTLALELIGRSRDLRVALPLTRAWLKLQGIKGFATGLLLIQQLLEQRWDSVHPQLDPDDDLDPMLRVNTVAALCEASTILRELRETGLVASKGYGRFCLRDIDIATGEMDAPAGVEKVALAVIDAAFREGEAGEQQEVLAALESAYASSCAIELTLTAKVGAARAIDLSPLSKMLKRARDFVRERSAAPAPDSAAQAGADTAAAPAAPGDAAAPAAPAPPRGDISSRDDVVRMLDKICAYYASHEPSSPIPLLLLRAQRLVDKSFMEILQDLAPDGVGQLQIISGIQSES